MKGLLETGCGLLDQDGVSLRLLVDLRYRRTEKTNARQYLFTLFQRQPYGLERIYQLDVRQYPRVPKDAHLLPHEHIGKARVTGNAGWANWSYDEAMARFCTMTNIVFRPNLPHPEDFRLRGQ